MATDYDPQHAPPIVHQSTTVSQLKRQGRYPPIVLRLLKIWAEPHVDGDGTSRITNSLWVDKEGRVVEVYSRYTWPLQTPYLLREQNIYVFYTVWVVNSREQRRYCAADKRIVLPDPGRIQHLPSAHSKPWFPLTGYKATPFEHIPRFIPEQVQCIDVVGRLLKVQLGVIFDDRLCVAAVQVEDTRGNRVWAGLFTDQTIAAEVMVTDLLDAESRGPVIIAVTSMLPCHRADIMSYYLRATPASRIVQTKYVYKLKATYDRFAHDHMPIMTVEDDYTSSGIFLRGLLPPLTTLDVLAAYQAGHLAYLKFPLRSRIEIGHLADYHIATYVENGVVCWNQPYIECFDDTAALNFCLDSHSASMLLRCSPLEYAAMSEDMRHDLLQSLQGTRFCADISRPPAGVNPPFMLVITTLFHHSTYYRQ